jgi:CO/xanthine dehydrogenase Mo-binding subunit
VYVIESFIDELAATAKKDPVEYRRALLQKNPRALHVLNRAAELSSWGKPLGPRQGRGVSVQQAFGTYMCQVAEVTVSKTGEVHVDRVYVVLDTGVVINPDTVAAQMQSGVIFGISMVLWGEITLDKGRVQQSNFDNYRVMRIDEAPKIEIEIVKSEADPGGIGEPGTSGLTPAVLNAVYAATGVRLRKTPIDSNRLKQAS